jgi:hypothetical protein
VWLNGWKRPLASRVSLIGSDGCRILGDLGFEPAARALQCRRPLIDSEIHIEDVNRVGAGCVLNISELSRDARHSPHRRSTPDSHLIRQMRIFHVQREVGIAAVLARYVDVCKHGFPCGIIGENLGFSDYLFHLPASNRAAPPRSPNIPGSVQTS